MRLQAFRLCHQFHRPADIPEPLLCQLLEADLLYKTIQAYPAICPGIPVGRQHMIGAAGIIACALGGEMPEKDGAPH